jgi:hypothetical protein
LILNCDEAPWKVYPNDLLTWWHTGAGDVSICANGDGLRSPPWRPFLRATSSARCSLWRKERLSAWKEHKAWDALSDATLEAAWSLYRDDDDSRVDSELN